MATSKLPVADVPLEDRVAPKADPRPRILVVCDDAALSAELVRRLSDLSDVVAVLPDDIVEPVRDEQPDVLETFALYAAQHEAVLAPLVVNEPDERHGAYGPPRRGRKGKLLRW